ncbi:MAG: histidinol phosphate phosphatase domain-containing protein [Candidatus Heimdallarchaeota archaeon]
MFWLNRGVEQVWCDFHIHSIFSDGELLPSELARRAVVIGLPAIAITDHVDHSNLEQVIHSLKKAVDPWLEEISIIVGVEISYVRPVKIAELATHAKKLGAQLVLVHGETLVEPGIPGTNDAVLKAEDVDILAHPGLITKNQAELARDQEKFLELTYRQGHCLTNGHIARLARDVEAKLLVNTDCHSIELIDADKALKVAKGAGLADKMAREVVYEVPLELLKRLEQEGEQ